MLPKNGQADNEAVFNLAHRIHCYVSEHIRFADTKATAILAGSGILLAFPLSQFATIGNLLKTVLEQSNSFLSPLPAILSSATILLLGAFAFTVWHCILCFHPRLTQQGTSLIFFEDIASHTSPVDYATKINSLTEAQTLDELSAHSYSMSKVCSKKFHHVRYATIGFLIAIVLAVMYAGLLIKASASFL